MTTRKPITDREREIVRARYADERADDIARDLGCSLNRVYRIAHLLGLKKSDAFFASPESGRNNYLKGAGTRFPKGQTPWNKGQKFEARGRSAETQFKKGRPACESRNYKPIGSLRITRDGYLERKVTDDPSIVPTLRWKGVHRLVWEASHGPVPPGHIVVFRPGAHTVIETEITLDRLEMISRRELMSRNTLHNYPQPIPQLIQLRGQLQRKLNRRKKDGKEQNG